MEEIEGKGKVNRSSVDVNGAKWRHQSYKIFVMEPWAVGSGVSLGGRHRRRRNANGISRLFRRFGGGIFELPTLR